MHEGKESLAKRIFFSSLLDHYFSNFSYLHWREVTKFDNTEQAKVRPIISIDSEMVNIHTCRYVRWSPEEAKVP